MVDLVLLPEPYSQVEGCWQIVAYNIHDATKKYVLGKNVFYESIQDCTHAILKKRQQYVNGFTPVVKSEEYYGATRIDTLVCGHILVLNNKHGMPKKAEARVCKECEKQRIKGGEDD